MSRNMGFILLAAAVALTIWVWATWGWFLGLIAGVSSFVAVSLLRSRNAQRNLEFHEAWDSIIGPPMTLEARASKRNLHRPEWKSENRRTGISARDYILREGEWQQAWNSLVGSLMTVGELSYWHSPEWATENRRTGISARDYILRNRPLNPEGPDINGLTPEEALFEAMRWNAEYGDEDGVKGSTTP